MLKQIKTLGLALVVGCMMVGCTGITDTESYKEGRMDVSEEYQALPADTKKGHRDGEKWRDDIKAGFSVNTKDVADRGLSLYNDGTIKDITLYFNGVLEYLDFEGITDAQALEEILRIFNESVPVTVVEEPKQQSKQEVQQKPYCEWCETTTDHSSDNHIGQCYDCGEEMKASLMSFNGRSFHCGCVDYSKEQISGVVINCSTCGIEMLEEHTLYDAETGLPVCGDCASAQSNKIRCEGCDRYFDESEMIEETQNGVLYCFDCYGPIMDAIMGGPANGDLDE